MLADYNDCLVTIDLDSTLADTEHRHGLIDRENGTDWHAYSAACADDTPILAAVTLVRLLVDRGVEVHALSGRKASALPATKAWFLKHDIPITEFWLDETDAGDYPSPQAHVDYKISRVYDIERATSKTVVLHVDDWAGVAVGLAEVGIPCLCVRTPTEIRRLTAPVPSQAHGFEALK